MTQSERRLHPLSILFALGGQLKAMLLPLIAILFVSRGGGAGGGRGLEIIMPAILIFSGLAAAARYFSFRYRYDENEMVVRTGIFFRNERHIPYARIQNIDAVQNLVHRTFSVAEVHVQTGTAGQAEATLSVLPMDALAEMRSRVFANRASPAVTADVVDDPAGASAHTTAAESETSTLLHLGPGELMLCGLIENRGMVLLLAGMGVLYELFAGDAFVERVIDSEISGGGTFRQQISSAINAGGVELRTVLIGMSVVLALLLFVRLISVVWAMVRLHNFTLTRRGDDLRTEYGFFTRVSATIPLRRIQLVTVRESIIHRLTGRVSVRVATAGGSGGVGGGMEEREWLAPILKSEELPGLLAMILPQLDYRTVEWNPVHERAFKRAVKGPLSAAIAASLALYLAFQLWVFAAAPLVLLAAFAAARMYVRYLGWSVTPGSVLMRKGWFWRYVSIAPLSKIQVVRTVESPFDRRTGMCSLQVDTAGAHEATGLTMRYLSLAQGSELGSQLARAAAHTTFRW